MKFIHYLIICFLLFSCKDSEVKKTILDKPIDSTKTDSSQVKPAVYAEKENDINDFDILIPSEYRDWENKNEVDKLTENWLDLFQKDGNYYLEKVNYTIQRGYSECSGDSTKIINSKNKSLLYINNPTLKRGQVNFIKIKKNKIWPNEKLSFEFGNEIYTLRAEGKVLSSQQVHTDDGVELFQEVENYKLYIATNTSSESLFLEEDSFNDTFVELVFVGDLDGDQKPDFIFRANRNYEESRVILFLSSKSKKGKIIKKVSEVSIQFDC